jgi:hypothetical protein
MACCVSRVACVSGSGSNQACAPPNEPFFAQQGVTLLNGYANSGGMGGGAVVIKGDTAIRKCIFRGNYAAGDAAGDGGAVQGWSGMGLIETCIFAGNAAGRWGGALETHQSGSTVTVVNCTMTRNDAALDGGGV